MAIDDTCPNCDRLLHGQFCSFCGQNQKGVDRYFLTLVNEAFEGLFSLESKAWRTTFYLLFKPGFLSLEYFENRRAHYITPLRLYLITSIGFFLLLSMITFFSSNPVLNGDATADLPKTEASVTPQGETSEPQTQQFKTLEEAYKESPTKVELNLPFIKPETREKWSAALEAKIANAVSIVSDRPKLLISKLIDSSPPVVMLLLPIFALILKLFYLRSRRYYAQYLVLALHNHSFFFAAMILITLISMLIGDPYKSWFSDVAWIYVAVYMVLSLRRVFKQSWKLTIAKSAGLMMAYTGLFFAGVVCITILSVMLV